MSKNTEEIAKAIKDLAGDHDSLIIPAIVKSINDDFTCVVEFEGIEIDIRMTAIIDNDDSKSVIIPAVNSSVLIAFIGNSETDAVIVAYSNIKEITINANKITINNGNNGGLIKIDELKSQLQKNNQILQALITVLSGVVIPEPGNGSPSALQLALKSLLSGKQLADFSNIENDKITH